MKKLLLLAIVFGLLHSVVAQEKARVIFDTDMGPDYDDVGAIALLHAFADSGKAEILATIASTKYKGVASVLDVLNSYFNRPDLPIGVPGEDALELRDWQHWSDTLIAKYPHSVRDNGEAVGAVELYRKLLSAQPDNSVTIISVGFITNLSNLLKSTADQYSNLNGTVLVKRKVKLLVSMAGKFPSGKEFNVEKDAAASQYAFQHWPTKIYFSGFEIGQRIKTGLPLINNSAITKSPVKDVFSISIPMADQDSAGRMSWDQTAVLVGVLGYENFYELKPGRIDVASDGGNTWNDKSTGHYYLVEKIPAAKVEALINKLMMHQPVRN